MILAGDIGATNSRLAMFNENFEVIEQNIYKSQEYKSFKDIVYKFIETYKYPIKTACFGIPGPVREGKCKLTNVPWDIVDASELSEVVNSDVALINDAEANAYGLETLRDDELVTLNVGSKIPGGNRCVVAVGTSLGEALLIDVEGRLHALGTEGGSADFGPFDELQWELIRYTQQKYKRVSYEIILGGQGLVQIYDFLRDTGTGVSPLWLEQEMQVGDKAAAINNAAQSGQCELCVQALELFVSILAAECGNAAVKYFSTGGIYLGGGMAPNILKYLQLPLFVENFVNKDKMREFLQAIPVYVILNQYTALQGAAWYAKRSID
jgi:glucokinase